MGKINISFENDKGKQETISIKHTAQSFWFLSSNMRFIDLSPLPDLLNLEEIKFTTPKLIELDLEPISKCSQLKRLSILKAPRLRKLDLSPLSSINLEVLVIESTSIPKLDITPLGNCVNLRAIKISKNIVLIASDEVKSHLNRAIDKIYKRIRWISSPANVTTKSTTDKLQKLVLGVLKSFPRVSIEELIKYTHTESDQTRDLVFQLIGEGLVEGRFDSSTDTFISTDAALASKKAKSGGLSIQLCVYCNKPLPKILAPGEELPCPACGIINIG
jgi:hypothetical protein